MEPKERPALKLVRDTAQAMRDVQWSPDACWHIARAALSGSSATHQIQSVAPVLDPAAISDQANAERLPEPFLGPAEASS